MAEGAGPTTNKVVLHLYDLSMGMAKTMSPGILGKEIQGIWHTGVVVYGMEYFYGGGIQKCPPQQVTAQFGISPVQTVELGTTTKSPDTFQAYLQSIQHKYTPEKYDLFHNNCNNFSDEAARYLTGNSIPQHILDLPNEVLQTPMGQTIAPMMRAMNERMQQNMMPFTQGSSGAQSAQTETQQPASSTDRSSVKVNEKSSQKVLFKLVAKVSGKSLETHQLEFGTENPTIGEIKIELQRKSGYAAADQRIIYAGTLLRDDTKKASDVGLKDGITLHMSPKVSAVKQPIGTSHAPQATGTSQASQAVNSGSKVTTVVDAVNKMKQSSEKERKVALKTLVKIMDNVVNNPNDPKYRKIKKNNPAFQKRLHNVPGSLDVLYAIGFTESDEGGEAMLRLEATKEGWERLVDGKKKVQAELDAIQSSSASSTQPAPNMGMPMGGMGFPGFGTPGANPPPMGGGGNFNFNDSLRDAAMSSLMNNPEFLSAAMNHPSFQQMAQNNPMMQTMMEQVRQNPQMLQQMMNMPIVRERIRQMQNNPELAQEQFNQMASAMGGSGQGFMPPLFPPMGNNGANTTPNSGINGNGNVGTNSNGNSNSSENSNGGNDQQMTEEEMIQEAIRRSLQEQ